MADYKPLFAKESVRTRQFRRVIIRKTLKIIRENPDLTDQEIMILAEKEAVKVCDLCVESSFEEKPHEAVGQYFLKEGHSERRDHVGRLFLHPLDGHLRKGNLKECLIPVFCQSVVNLLGQDGYDAFSKRIDQMVKVATNHGIVFREMLDSPPAKALTQEIIDAYRKEMKRTGGFAAQLKNQIDTALVNYQRDNPTEEFDIEQGVESAYNDFIELMGLNNSEQETGDG